jgi:hypothetical protein
MEAHHDKLNRQEPHDIASTECHTEQGKPVLHRRTVFWFVAAIGFAILNIQLLLRLKVLLRTRKVEFDVPIGMLLPDNRVRIALREHASEFVVPHTLLLTSRAGELQARIDFEFGGEPKPSRQMQVALEIFSADDRLIGRQMTICSDKRLADAAIRVGTKLDFHLLPVNCPTMTIPLPAGKAHEVVRARVRFAEL